MYEGGIDNLVVPVAGNHIQVGASFCAEIRNRIVAAIDVGKVLVEAYIKHVKLIVVAKQALQEGLIAECKSGKVVVAANQVEQYAAIFS